MSASTFDWMADPSLSDGDRAYRGQLKSWMAVQAGRNQPAGVMISIDSPGWDQWRDYFRRHDCRTELRRMKLVERGNGYSRDPVTGRSIMQVAAEYPSDFDLSGSTGGDYRNARAR